jgi:hypothetical protein
MPASTHRVSLHQFLSVPRLVAAAAFASLVGAPYGLEAQGRPQSLPPQASPVAQDIVQFDGELEVQYEDSAAGPRLLHYLRTPNGNKMNLQFTDQPLDWLSGTQVRVRGRMRDANTLQLSAAGDVQTLALPTANTFGAQNTLVILINFQDNSSQPYSLSSANTTTFQTTSDFYYENSYHQTWLTGTVVGWFKINATSASCATDTWASLADQAAQNAGVNLSNYPRRIYGFPDTASCNWWGLGSVGGNPSRAWINGDYVLKVVGHEFGHNLGEYHSHSQACDSSGCSTSEYGDDHDIMGNPTSGHLNAFQKERLGWLNYGGSPPIQTITQSGSYHVDAIEPMGTAPKALKILASTDGSGLRTFYYVEARANTGFDAGISSGVLVHTGYEGSGNSSYETDLDPVSSNFDVLLDPGQTFTDATAGVSITTASIDGTGATMTVSVNAPACTQAAPSVSMSPSNMVSAAPGASVAYTMSVKNNDSSTCDNATFGMNSLLPAGWTAGFGSPTLSLAPGASGSTAFSLTSAANSSGQYAFQNGAMRSGPSASVTEAINIISSFNVTLSTGGKGSGYQISAAVKANGAAVSGASVTFTLTDPRGGSRTLSATTNSSGVATVSFRPKRNDPSGTYAINAVASMGGVSGTASGTLTVR